ncbi:MAG TPA: hypothetical protein VHZ78_09115 [Rhizomicrobium sp.]|jgi:hypothetical protein|nr:hypothetical protein [Rhizomicrobium sp.]
MRTRFRLAGLVFAALSLCGCGLLLGESITAVHLYNPATHEQLQCGPGVQGGGPSREQLAQMDTCVAVHEAKGFRRWQPGDGAPPPPQGR